MTDKQEVVGWQFCRDGEWFTGSNYGKHRKNVEAEGFPIRELYAGEVIQTEAGKKRDEQIGRIETAYKKASHSSNTRNASIHLYSEGVRVIAPDEYVVKRLTDEQIQKIFYMYPTLAFAAKKIIDAVQHELGITP